MLHISTTTNNNNNNKFGKHILAAAKDHEKNVNIFVSFLSFFFLNN